VRHAETPALAKDALLDAAVLIFRAQVRINPADTEGAGLHITAARDVLEFESSIT